MAGQYLRARPRRSLPGVTWDTVPSTDSALSALRIAASRNAFMRSWYGRAMTLSQVGIPWNRLCGLIRSSSCGTSNPRRRLKIGPAGTETQEPYARAPARATASSTATPQDAIRARTEKFVADTPLTRRVEAVIGDSQFLGVSEPKKHRETLIKAIADDVRLMQSTFGGSQTPVSVSLTGIESRAMTRPVGPLDLEIYIPYSMSLRSGAGT